MVVECDCSFDVVLTLPYLTFNRNAMHAFCFKASSGGDQCLNKDYDLGVYFTNH